MNKCYFCGKEKDEAMSEIFESGNGYVKMCDECCDNYLEVFDGSR